MPRDHSSVNKASALMRGHPCDHGGMGEASRMRLMTFGIDLTQMELFWSMPELIREAFEKGESIREVAVKHAAPVV